MQQEKNVARLGEYEYPEIELNEAIDIGRRIARHAARPKPARIPRADPRRVAGHGHRWPAKLDRIEVAI